MGLFSSNYQIANIEVRSSFYDLIDAKGKKYKTLSRSIGEIVGFSGSFFIVRRSSFYDIYNSEGRKQKTLAASIGDLVSVAGDFFVVRRSSFHDTYDKSGKKSVLAQPDRKFFLTASKKSNSITPCCHNHCDIPNNVQGI